MESIEQAQAQEQLDQILTDLQHEPIVIQRRGEDIAIPLSMVDYDRFRVSAVRAFLDVRNDIAREARAAGLSEDRLSEILNDD